jgi:TPR repeat protein
MNETNEFALVPRPPSAIEKAESGAKRVLAGMVADVLAVATLADAEKLSSRAFNYYFGWGVERDYAEAVRLFREAAMMGNANAQNYLGICYSEGWGLDKDLEQAIH